MLVAIFAILILGGGGSGILDFIADTQDEITIVMEKGDRQKEALAILKAMKKRTAAHDKVIRQTSKNLEKALSVDGDYDAIWTAYFEQMGTHNSDMLDLRFQLREQLTRDEWQQVFSGD